MSFQARFMINLIKSYCFSNWKYNQNVEEFKKKDPIFERILLKIQGFSQLNL